MSPRLSPPSLGPRPSIDFRSAALLLPGLASTIAAQLLASPRLAERAAAFLEARLGRMDLEGLDDCGRDLLNAAPDAIHAFTTLAGAVLNGHRLRLLVTAAEIADLANRIGPRARRVALDHLSYATPASTDRRDLVAGIEADGASAFSTWLDTLPHWAAGRIRLKWHSMAPAYSDPEAQARALAIIYGLWETGALPRPVLGQRDE
jgi:hypothetical protein